MNGNPLGVHVKRIALGILAQAQRDGATDLVMAAADDERQTSVRQKVGDVWHDWVPVGVAWPEMLCELGGLAGIRKARFPKNGIIYIAYSGVRLWWHVAMPDQDECVLHNLAAAPL